MADFQFPNFGVSGFPYQNYVQQLLASLGPMGGTIPSGAPQGSQWNPIQQVPAPPLTPGMQMPAVPPGGSGLKPNNPLVPPAGYNGPMPSAPAPTGSMPSPNGAIPKPSGNNKMATGGLLNVAQGAPGIQATTDLTGATGQQFGFTVPQGANGMGQFSFSPTGDQTAVNRQVSFTDANGNPIPGLSSTGIESGQYFNIGPGGDPNLPM